MPDVDFGALTIPVFASIFGAGWAACYLWIAKPLQARLTKAEAQIDALFLMFQKKAMGE